MYSENNQMTEPKLRRKCLTGPFTSGPHIQTKPSNFNIYTAYRTTLQNVHSIKSFFIVQSSTRKDLAFKMSRYAAPAE